FVEFAPPHRAVPSPVTRAHPPRNRTHTQPLLPHPSLEHSLGCGPRTTRHTPSQPHAVAATRHTPRSARKRSHLVPRPTSSTCSSPSNSVVSTPTTLMNSNSASPRRWRTALAAGQRL